MYGDMPENDESVTTVAIITTNRGMSCILWALIDKLDFHTRLLTLNIIGLGNLVRWFSDFLNI
jgi:hypothetical protein